MTHIYQLDQIYRDSFLLVPLLYDLFTLPGSYSECNPNSYIVLCRTFTLHRVGFRFQFQLPSTGMESESGSGSLTKQAITITPFNGQSPFTAKRLLTS